MPALQRRHRASPRLQRRNFSSGTAVALKRQQVVALNLVQAPQRAFCTMLAEVVRMTNDDASREPLALP